MMNKAYEKYNTILLDELSRRLIAPDLTYEDKGCDLSLTYFHVNTHVLIKHTSEPYSFKVTIEHWCSDHNGPGAYIQRNCRDATALDVPNIIEKYIKGGELLSSYEFKWDDSDV